MAGEDRFLLTPSRPSDLPVDWTWKPLNAVCEGVYDCPHSTPALAECGPYVARSQDMRSGVFRTDEAASVSEATYIERIARAEPRHGDLLYSREGTYFGIAAGVPPGVRVCLGQRMVLIRPKVSVIDFRFLKYWLNSPVMALHTYGHRDGSVAERLNLPTIRGLPVACPPLAQQRAIAHILGTLDDKIELNRRMNGTLEAIARALFKSWFVDFDPLLDIAPGSRGRWRSGKLSDLATVSRQTINPQRSPSESYDHYSIPAFDNGRVPEVSLGATIKSGKFLVPSHAVLLSKLNPETPRVWMPSIRSGRRSICSTEFLVLEPTACCSREFLYALVTSSSFHDEFVTFVTGGTNSHQRVKADSARSMEIATPNPESLALFTSVSAPLYKRVALNLQESLTLAALRDTLLPKLISGELRVKDAERLIESER